MNPKWTLLAAVLTLAPGTARAADTRALVVRGLAGTLHIHQTTPAGCPAVEGDVPVIDGRLELAPAEGVAAGGGRYFVLTGATVAFSGFSTHVSCLLQTDDRTYDELTVQVRGAVPFVAAAVGSGVYTFSLPPSEVLLYQAAIVNGALDTGYQHPAQPVAGVLDLANGTIQLTVVGSTSISVPVLGDYAGTLTATLSGSFPPPNHAPSAVCADAALDAGPACTAAATPEQLDGGSSDPDGDPLLLSLAPAGPFTLGATGVTLTAADSHGASASCPATVTVTDRTSPAVSCPASVTRPSDPGRCSASVSAGSAAAADNCPGIAVGAARADGQPLASVFPVGTTAVTWTAADPSGNATTCRQDVIVQDVQRPSMRCLEAHPSRIWPPNHRLVPVTVTLSATDNCAPPTVKLLSVTCSDGCDAGDVDGAVLGTDDRSFRLRAELERPRHGHHDDDRRRTYTVTYSATDAAGNVDVDRAYVVVGPPGHHH